jgi:hypothetical protein
MTSANNQSFAGPTQRTALNQASRSESQSQILPRTLVQPGVQVVAGRRDRGVPSLVCIKVNRGTLVERVRGMAVPQPVLLNGILQPGARWPPDDPDHRRQFFGPHRS